MPTEVEIKRQLEKILSCKPFSRQTQRANLLRTLVTLNLGNDRDALRQKELATKLEKQLSTISAQASQVRESLKIYYKNEGKHDPIVIDLLPGYKIEFRLVPESPMTSETYSTTDNEATTSAEIDGKDLFVLIVKEGTLKDLLAYAALNEPKLRALSGFRGFRIKAIKRRSIYLYFRCSSDGYGRLVKAWRTGELEAVIGLVVIDLRAAPEFLSSPRKQGIISRVIEFCGADWGKVAFPMAFFVSMCFTLALFAKLMDFPQPDVCCSCCSFAISNPGTELERHIETAMIYAFYCWILSTSCWLLNVLCRHSVRRRVLYLDAINTDRGEV